MSNLNVSENSDKITPLKVEKKVKTETAPNSESNSSSSSSDQFRLAPRGMRIFHAHQKQPFETLKNSIEDLAGKHAKTLISIFHHQQFKKVSYKQFAALWRHINGPDSIKESTGSSHKALLDAKGRVVAGTFSHGDGMLYTHKTIDYPQDSLWMIGFGLETK
jgi:hypothetical protein